MTGAACATVDTSEERARRMDERAANVSKLLHEAGETHHRVYRIVDGSDDDWASWYADWLINLSELPKLLGAKPVRSRLVYWLVRLDLEYTAGSPSQSWQDFYAVAAARAWRSGGSALLSRGAARQARSSSKSVATFTPLRSVCSVEQ